MIPKQDLSRRRFIAGGAALAALPLLSHRSAAAEVDVVVVGAGAAGLAATRDLLGRGISVLTLEASSRVGGRAHTDLALFGVPYDIGAHWLHRAGTNPFVQHAKDNGFTAYPAPDTEALYVGDRKATEGEHSAYTAAYENAIRAISAAGRRGRDVSPASVVPDAGGWHDLVHFAIGPYEMAKDFDAFSCVDWWNSDDGRDFYCKEGYGALVAHSARDLDVSLSTRVTSIDWSGSGVAVETDRGRIRAKACIVTVSHRSARERGHPFRPRVARRDGRCRSRHQHGRLRPHRTALRRERARHRTRRVPPRTSPGMPAHVPIREGPATPSILRNVRGIRNRRARQRSRRTDRTNTFARPPALMGLLTNVSGTGADPCGRRRGLLLRWEELENAGAGSGDRDLGASRRAATSLARARATPTRGVPGGDAGVPVPSTSTSSSAHFTRWRRGAQHAHARLLRLGPCRAKVPAAFRASTGRSRAKRGVVCR